EADDRVLAAEAGFLGAAERHERARRAVLIHPRGADLETLGERLAALEIVRPDRAGQAVAGVVRAPDRVLDVAELEDRHDRAELLLPHEAASLVDVGHERRRDEVAGAFGDLAAAQDPRAAALRVLENVPDLVVLHLVLDRPELRVVLEPVADLRVARLFDERLTKRVVDFLLRVDPLDRHADLPAVDERREEHLLRDRLRVDVVENDRRVVPAELARYALQRRGRGGGDLLPGRDRPRERDLVDAFVLGHPSAELVAAGEHVDDARRKDLPRDLAELQRRERRIRRRLQHDRVARVERGYERPEREIHRGVPRRDDPDDPERPILQLDAALVVVDQHLDRNLDRDHAVRLRRAPVDLGDRLRQRLALLASQKLGELVLPLPELLREGADELRALRIGRPSPCPERFPGGADGPIELGAARGRRLGE